MKKIHGFNLIEMMIAMAIGGTLLAVGVPMMGDSVKIARVKGASNVLMGAMHVARSEAIKRGERVTVCPAETIDVDGDGTPEVSCTPSGSQLIVFRNALRDQEFNAGDDELIRHYPLWLYPGVGASWANYDFVTSASFVNFLPEEQGEQLYTIHYYGDGSFRSAAYLNQAQKGLVASVYICSDVGQDRNKLIWLEQGGGARIIDKFNSTPVINLYHNSCEANITS